MEIQEMDVTIDEKGHVIIQVRGVKGKACLDITAPLEQALGGNISREMTPESLDDPTAPIEGLLFIKS